MLTYFCDQRLKRLGNRSAQTDSVVDVHDLHAAAVLLLIAARSLGIVVALCTLFLSINTPWLLNMIGLGQVLSLIFLDLHQL